jgi:hypothetical protein
MSKNKIQWFARGGGLNRTGPFKTQVEAWEAMCYSEAMRKSTRLDHPPDTAVWPEKIP